MPRGQVTTVLVAQPQPSRTPPQPQQPGREQDQGFPARFLPFLLPGAAPSRGGAEEL